MPYYFSWHRDSDPFCTANLRKESAHIFSFSLVQREGEAALLNLMINQYIPTSKKSICFWWENEKNKDEITPLFRGSLSNVPLQNQEGLWSLDFVSSVNEDLFQALCEENQTHADMENLFFPQKSGKTRFLESTPSLIEFGRVHGESVLSPITKGLHVHPLKNILKNNTNIKVTHLPVDAVAMEILASWTQKDQGEVDIAPALSNTFSKGIINTYSGLHFQAAFPKEGSKVGSKRGHSGCRIVESSLEEIDPPSTGVLEIYPRVSPSFPGKSHDGEKRDIQLNRSWFKSSLRIEWIYEQRRREHLTLALAHTKKRHQHTKKITFSLSHFPEKIGGSFFKSAQGLKAANYAFLIAKTYLQASKRCVEISFEVPITEGFLLTTHSAVDVSCLLKKKNPLLAKVIEYKMIQIGPLGICKIRAALSLDDLFGTLKTEEEIVLNDTFFTPLHNISPKGILDTHPLHTLELVKNIAIKNPPEWQEDIMLGAKEDEEIDALDILKKHPTSFEITLQDLRTEKILEEHIDLGTLNISSHPIFSLGDIEDAD